MHLFSIITSVYNGQDYIERAVKSIVGQTETDYEYIIVDNGSSDETSNILSRLVLENPKCDIKIITLEPNKGISGGRNAGIEKAEGRFICFIDADDFWFNNKLEVVKENILNDQGIDVFCHWEEHQRGEQITVGKYRNVNNDKPYYDLLVNGNCLSTSAMTIRANKLKDVGGFDTAFVKGEEDYDCWLRLAQIGCKFYMITQTLGVWTIREDSVSAKIVQHTEAVLSMLSMHMENCQIDKSVQNKLVARNLVSCGRVMSLAKNFSDGNKLYKKALKVDRFSVHAYAGLLLNIIRR